MGRRKLSALGVVTDLPEALSLASMVNVCMKLRVVLLCQRLLSNQLKWGLRLHCIVSPGVVKLRRFCLIFPVFRSAALNPDICILLHATAASG